MNALERSDLADLRTELMHELRLLRDEIKELRSELDRLQGALALIRWLGPVTVTAAIVALARAYGVI